MYSHNGKQEKKLLIRNELLDINVEKENVEEILPVLQFFKFTNNMVIVNA